MTESNEMKEFDLDVRVVEAQGAHLVSQNDKAYSAYTDPDCCGQSAAGTCNTCDFCTRNYPRCVPPG
jgi:hypothetical protein